MIYEDNETHDDEVFFTCTRSTATPIVDFKSLFTKKVHNYSSSSNIIELEHRIAAVRKIQLRYGDDGKEGYIHYNVQI